MKTVEVVDGLNDDESANRHVDRLTFVVYALYMQHPYTQFVNFAHAMRSQGRVGYNDPPKTKHLIVRNYNKSEKFRFYCKKHSLINILSGLPRLNE